MQRPETIFFEADRLIEQGKVPEAFEMLQELIEQFPDYGRAYNHLGYIFETKFRDFKQSEAYYKKSLELSPEYPATYLNYAILLSTLERWEDLRALLNQGLSIPGINKAKIHNEYGIMFETLGDYEMAIEAYKGAVRYTFKSQDIEAYRNAVVRCIRKSELLGEEDRPDLRRFIQSGES